MRHATVLIADDHGIVVDGLVSLLKDDFDIVGTVNDGTQLIAAAARLRPDVVITDISMPGLTGIEALRQLKEARSDTKVILLTMHADPQLATEAIRAGASGFVVKHAAGDELVTAISEVLQGRIYLTPGVTKDVIAQMSDPSSIAEEHLSRRQRDVLRLLSEGRRIKEIAAVLNLSPRTVETYKYDMMQKLGIQSTAALVRYAIQNRLVAE